MLVKAGYKPVAFQIRRYFEKDKGAWTFRLVLLDMNFSLSINGEEGIELLRKIKILKPEMPVILITAWGSVELAVKGMKLGASDFVTKPWNNIPAT